MKIAYQTPWLDTDSGRMVTHVVVQRTRFPHENVGMEIEFKLYDGDELVSESTKASNVSNTKLLFQALTTLANDVKTMCEYVEPPLVENPPTPTPTVAVGDDSHPIVEDSASIVDIPPDPTPEPTPTPSADTIIVVEPTPEPTPNLFIDPTPEPTTEPAP